MGGLKKVKKDDLVQVTAGKEKGKKGKVLKVLPAQEKVIVEKLNIVKRHTKRTQQAGQGGIIEKEGALSISNVMLVCIRCDEKTRVGRKILKDGKKVRVCKKCKEVIDN
ncbi:MAG: 50S ribosomal protein L24 [Nitrospinota bacterium]